MTDNYTVAPISTTVRKPQHLHQVELLAHELMLRHGLADWSFKWDRAINRAGSCNHATRTLSFSKPNMSGWKLDACRLTILHEIAHALTPGHGHDWIWASKCREIGGDGRRNWTPNDDRPIAAKPIVGRCDCDPSPHSMARMPTRTYRCNVCRTRITWIRRSS